MTHGRNKLHAIWSTLSALQAAGITSEDPSWPLLRGLDISTAADVLATLQVRLLLPLCLLHSLTACVDLALVR